MEKPITREQEAEIRRRFERILSSKVPWTAGEFTLALMDAWYAIERMEAQAEQGRSP
jgi:hypothetical protein